MGSISETIPNRIIHYLYRFGRFHSLLFEIQMRTILKIHSSKRFLYSMLYTAWCIGYESYRIVDTVDTKTSVKTTEIMQFQVIMVSKVF